MEKIVRKAFINKRTNQYSVSIPKKEMRKLNPTLKFNRNLFVEIKIRRDKK